MKQLIKELAEMLRELWARFKFWSNNDKQCYHCCLWCKYFDDCYAQLNREAAEKLENEINEAMSLITDYANGHILVLTRKEHEIKHYGEQIEIHKATEQAIRKRMSLLKPYRWYDKIKDMSLDEMAEFLFEVMNSDDDTISDCYYCGHRISHSPFCDGDIGKDCINAFKKFLESEAKKTDEN